MEKNFAESAEAFYQAGHSLVKLLLDITTPDFEALRKAKQERMKNTISHDIAHCDYTLCPAKDRCRRYKAHLEDIKHDIHHCVYLLFEDDMKSRILELGSCPNFWLYEQPTT